MATTAKEVKDASHSKEKTKSTSSPTQNKDTNPAKRTTKSSIASSTASRGPAISTNKPSPHYLRGTVSSGTDVCKFGKKQASDDSSLKYSQDRRRSIEKPPSPSQLKRTLSASPRGRTLGTSSTPPKKGTSPKPVAVRSSTSKTPITSKTPVTSKTAKDGKAQQITKPVSIKKNPSTITRPKKETKSSTTSAAPPSPDTTEIPKEEKVAPVEEVPEETIKVVEEEGEHVENSHFNDQDSIDPNDSELKISDSCDSSILSENDELITEEAPIEDTEEKSAEVLDSEDRPKDGEQDNNSGTVADQAEEIKPQEPQDEAKVEEKEGETGDVDKMEINKDIAASVEEKEVADTPRRLKFQQPRHLAVKEVDDADTPRRLKFKRKEDAETKGENADSENVVLKHQDNAQGKKETQAYNDVIEETASKLVGKRKSKVKALVGAFETVINLENDAPQNEAEGA